MKNSFRTINLLLAFLFACSIGDNYTNDDLDAGIDVVIDANGIDAITLVGCYNGSGTMPEPSTQPVWNTDATNRTTPSGGLQASGYATNAIPTSGNLNWYKNLVYQWIGWFRTVITANGAVTAVANQDITVSGTGEFVHGDVILQLGATSGQTDGLRSNTTNYWRFFPSVSGSVPNCWLQVGTGGQVSFSIPLKLGDRIKSVRGYIRDTSGSHTIGMSLTDNSSTNDDATQVGSTQTSAGNGTAQTLSLTGLTTTIATGHFYTVNFVNNDSTGTTHAVYGVEVTYDHP